MVLPVMPTTPDLEPVPDSWAQSIGMPGVDNEAFAAWQRERRDELRAEAAQRAQEQQGAWDTTPW